MYFDGFEIINLKSYRMYFSLRELLDAVDSQLLFEQWLDDVLKREDDKLHELIHDVYNCWAASETSFNRVVLVEELERIQDSDLGSQMKQLLDKDQDNEKLACYCCLMCLLIRLSGRGLPPNDVADLIRHIAKKYPGEKNIESPQEGQPKEFPPNDIDDPIQHIAEQYPGEKPMESPQEGQPVYRRRRQQMLSDPPADKAFSEGEGQRKLSISCSPTEGTILLCGDKTIGRLPMSQRCMKRVPEAISAMYDEDTGYLAITEDGRLINGSMFEIPEVKKKVVKVLISKMNYALLLEDGTVHHNFKYADEPRRFVYDLALDDGKLVCTYSI